MTPRGRPPLLSDEAILDAALSAFAAVGYPAMSVRALNAGLGLSHETVSQRFGSKSDLFRAAVQHGVQRFIADFGAEIERRSPNDDLELLRATITAFIVATSHHPTLGNLLHHESISDDQRMILVSQTGFVERVTDTVALLGRLHAAGIIRRTGIRELWFLAHGAAAPLHFKELSTMFDPFDGPVDADELVHRMTDAIVRSMLA